MKIRNLLYDCDYETMDDMIKKIEVKARQIIRDGKMNYFIEEPLNILKTSLCYWENY